MFMTEAKKKAAASVAATKSLVPKSEAESLRLQLAALKVERDFWVEQARNLQNHLQTVMRGQAAMLEQMARGTVTNDDVLSAVGQMANELRQPLTTVEATRAMVAMADPRTQGAYTSLAGSKAKAVQNQ